MTNKPSARMDVPAWENPNVKALVELELARNAPLRAVVHGYEQLSDEAQAVFNLLVGYSQDTAGNSGGQRRPSRERIARTGGGGIQPLVRSLMKTLLEDWPTLLDDRDIGNLMNSDYCKNTLGLTLGNLAFLRRLEAGTDVSGYPRYWAQPYAGKFYVSNNWWKNHHRHNAECLSMFVTQIIQRNPNHPGIPALERQNKAFRDYVG